MGQPTQISELGITPNSLSTAPSSEKTSVAVSTTTQAKLPKPHTSGLAGEMVFHEWQLMDGEELTLNEQCMLFEVLSSKVKVELLDPANKDSPEYAEALRLWHHFIDERVKRPYFLKMLKYFDKNHSWKNYNFQDFFPKPQKGPDGKPIEVSPTDLFNHQRYLQLKQQFPDIKCDCYRWNGMPMYRVRDGRRLKGLQLFDEYLAEQKTKQKAKEQPKQEGAITPDERYATAVRELGEKTMRLMKLGDENEKLKRQVAALTENLYRRDKTIAALREENAEFAALLDREGVLDAENEQLGE